MLHKIVVVFHAATRNPRAAAFLLTCAPIAASAAEASSISPADTGFMIAAVRQMIREGQAPGTLATLESARAQTVVVNAASQAACVRNIPQAVVRQVLMDNHPVRAVRGIESIFEKAVIAGKMPHESGLVDWSVPADKLDVRDYRHFGGPCRVPSAS